MRAKVKTIGLVLVPISAAIGSPAGAVLQQQPLWGDTHLHTSLSFDAYMYGNVSADPDTAYRFAKGQPVLHPMTKNWVRLERPLDFLVVADHAERLGSSKAVGDGDPRMMKTPWLRQMHELVVAGEFKKAFDIVIGAFMKAVGKETELDNKEIMKESWDSVVDVADAHYRPGHFTSIVGWEWSSMPGGNNLHRVVMTTASGAVAKSFHPFSWNDSARPEDLWTWLDQTSARTGAEFVAIPHNSNVSGGKMFDVVDSDGRAIDRNYAQIRARWEPAVEVTQTKGDSETAKNLSPNDEFAGFEFFPSMLLDKRVPSTTPADYARGALRRGMELENRIGVNPYKFGMIGSTDIHIGLSSTEEWRFDGKLGTDSRTVDKDKPMALSDSNGWDISASGRAAVWAKENTREAIMAAFKRREIYGTTGSRIVLRFFGGFGFQKADAKAKDIAAVGYRKGVPMGGDLTQAKGKAPSFLVYAVKDPDDGNLDRIQIVKGWLDSEGRSHEKVFDVVWSGNRKPGADGKLPAVGNTVDLKTARYTNTIGAAQLATAWTDPEFNPKTRAFYYVRVLQIPTPRNTLYDAIALGIAPEKIRAPATIQDRAYSSPIWYTPT